MSLKLKCHKKLKCHEKTDVAPKLKCYQSLNFTLTEMLQNLTISSKWNLNQNENQEIGTDHLGLVYLSIIYANKYIKILICRQIVFLSQLSVLKLPKIIKNYQLLWKLSKWSKTVWLDYWYIQIYFNMFGQIYSFSKTFVDFSRANLSIYLFMIYLSWLIYSDNHCALSIVTNIFGIFIHPKQIIFVKHSPLRLSGDNI